MVHGAERLLASMVAPQTDRQTTVHRVRRHVTAAELVWHDGPGAEPPPARYPSEDET